MHEKFFFPLRFTIKTVAIDMVICLFMIEKTTKQQEFMYQLTSVFLTETSSNVSIN